MLGIVAAALLSAPAPDAMATPTVAEPQPPDQFEMHEIWEPLGTMLYHLNMEEFVMLLTAVLPVCMGIWAVLNAITNVSKVGGESADASSLGELSASVHHDVEQATSALQGGVGKVEQQLADLQRAHDTRFADLHKDLAGIVWELSKLRADMARWQALAQLGARGARSGASPSPKSAAAAGQTALPDSERLPAPLPDVPRAVALGEENASATQAAQAAAGARAWRDS